MFLLERAFDVSTNWQVWWTPRLFPTRQPAGLRCTECTSDDAALLQPPSTALRASQKKIRRDVLKQFVIAFALLANSSIAFAGGKSYINTEREGIALKGYDAVAYFTLGKPTQGTKEFAFQWMDAMWYFASEKHLALFKADPEKYAPQYGGYCAWAVGHNYTYPSDPLAWKIVEGKLYLNADKSVQAMWLKEIPELIIKGDKNYPAVLNR